MRDILLDVRMPHKFCESTATAERNASFEAANCGGVILRVKSVQVTSEHAIFVGLIPEGALSVAAESRVLPSQLPMNERQQVGDVSALPQTGIRPRAIGNLHLTWNGLLFPADNEDVGYLVLQGPVEIASRMLESKTGDDYWAALSVPREFHDLRPVSIGAVCCIHCNRPITQQRLEAVPGTRHCVECQQKMEKEEKQVSK